MMEDAWQCIQQEKHLLAHAPTGIGKTAAVLGPALTQATREDSTVFFVTPKLSQHVIAVKELKRLAEKNKLDFTGVDLIGRKNSCPDPGLEYSDPSSFYEICRKKRKQETCAFYANARGFNAAQKARARVYFEKFMKDYETVESGPRICSQSSGFNPPLCSYELMLRIAEKSNVIICDYSHLFSPHVSRVFLSKTKKKLEGSIVVIDEAQNAPSRIMDGMSLSLTPLGLNRALKEAKKVDSPVKSLVQKWSLALEGLGRKHGKQALLEKKDLPLPSLDELQDLMDTGMDYLEKTGKNRSFCLSVANFFSAWREDREEYARLLNEKGVKYKCLDPSLYTQPVINEARSVIAMSGTLTPLEMYRDVLGFPENSLLREYPSPFPSSNKLCLVCDGATTKYSMRSPGEYKKISTLVDEVVASVPGNTAVFFPSYGVMKKVVSFMENERPLLLQKTESTPSQTQDLLEKFKSLKKKGCVLCGVSGGSLAEGVDYPGRDLLCVVVVGVPLAEWNLENQCLISYYEHKFGQGWNYGYLFPAMAKAVQAGGRTVRSETDRGVIVFLDERFAWPDYSKCFPSELEPELASKPGKTVNDFFNKKH
jgi:DNA excision repair protein ERCC-2